MVNLQLMAVYADAQGKELAKTPLEYNTKASMWTPSLTSSSSSCATGQFDAVFQQAARQLVGDMTKAIPQLYGQPPNQPVQAQQGTPTPHPLTGSASILRFRSMLEDANGDLVLEGGERIVLKVETTNGGNTILPNVELNLSGSPELVKAFTATMEWFL